jgi:uncharacterized protein (DUF2062 family)
VKAFAGLFNKWVINPFNRFLKTGLSPEKLAQSFSFGVILGLMPLPGSSLTCTIASFLFRLNFGAIQLINYMVAPLQLVLLIPFYKAGAAITGSEVMKGTLNDITERFKSDLWGMLYELGSTAVAAVALWVVISVPLGIVLYRITLPVFRKIALRQNGDNPAKYAD